MTFHASRVAHPVFIDRRTLVYLATSDDGSGPWLHVLDTRRRESRRVHIGTDRYESLAASADGRRLLATVVRPMSTLWRLPVANGVTDESAATRIALPTTAARSPRYGPGYLLYVSSKRGQEGIWKLAGDAQRSSGADRRHASSARRRSPRTGGTSRSRPSATASRGCT